MQEVYEAPPLFEKTIGEVLAEMAQRFPDREALIAPQRGVRLTWKTFDEKVTLVAKGLLGLGVRKDDHIAVMSTNYPEWILLQFATAKIGAVLVTVNTNYKSFELEYLLKQSDATTLFISKGVKDMSYPDLVRGLCPTLEYSAPGKLSEENFPHLINIVYMDEDTPSGMYNFSYLYEIGGRMPDSVFDAFSHTLSIHDVVNMQYTSGTTGFPKGVMLTHYNVANNGKQIGDCMNLTENDRLLIHVPLFHCFGCVLGVMACVTHATTIVLIDHFSPKTSMRYLEEEECTAVHGVPTMFIAMLNHPDFEAYDFSHLRTGIMAGSPCPVEVMKQVVDKMNMKEITISYGQTECSPVCTMTTTYDSIEKRVSTVGKVLPHLECKIVDPEKNTNLLANTIGEIVVRGYSIMKGYYKMPEATAAAIDEEGWLHTGDLGLIDEDGYFKITGRLKDMIIRGGENIYPKEIEELLYTHPQVKDVQVIGVPDKKYGEAIMACIIPFEDSNPTEDDIKEFVAGNMARHKVPAYVAIVESFPMNAAGKIQKYKMREWAIEKYNLQDAASVVTA